VALIKTGQALSLRPDILKNEIWAEELGKLSDAVGSFSDKVALKILCSELKDIAPKIEERQKSLGLVRPKGMDKTRNSVILDLFEFYNDKCAVASASIGQVYKAKVRRGPLLEAAIGKHEADYWGGKTVAIKVQRPDAARSASLDMYLLRRAAEWLSLWRGGDLTSIADQVRNFDMLQNSTNSAVYCSYQYLGEPHPVFIVIVWNATILRIGLCSRSNERRTVQSLIWKLGKHKSTSILP